MFKIMNMPDDPVYSILGEMDFTYAQDRQVVLVRETCRNANALNVYKVIHHISIDYKSSMLPFF